MEDRSKEKNTPWLSVPQFGDWDQNGPMPDYSMDFSKIRENRKQNKREVSRASLGNEGELMAATAADKTSRSPNVEHEPFHHHQQQYHESHAPAARRGIFSYFNCCVKA